MTRRADYFPMGGGENLVDSPLDIRPGESLYAYNYECDTRANYRRVGGYERVDGRPSPTDVSYSLLNFVTGVSAIAVGDTITGATSGHTAEVVLVTISSGSWAGGDAVGFLILMNQTGTFSASESLEVAATPSATTNGAATAADNDADDATYQQAAIEARRAKIGAVPGSGSVLGVWSYNGTDYAFRNNVGGTACDMYKSSTSGWTLVDLGGGIPFTAGTAAPTAGETVTGAVSGATAVVTEAVVTSGSWAAGTAAGTMYVRTIAGTFQAEVVTGATSASLTSTGAAVLTTLAPSGRYEFQNYNFTGASAGFKMYGVSGVHKAFQFDGSGFVPITTGMAVDTPSHLRCHRKHLFLSFDASLQHSLPGEPLKWSAVLGAGELGIGDAIVGMETTVGDSLAIFSRNSTHVLYGSSIQDWNLVVHSPESGAVEWTIQAISGIQYMNDRGVTNLAAAQTYGDFRSATVSEKIQPLLSTLKATMVASVRVREKDQYRLYTSGGEFVTGTFSRGKILGWTRGEYPNPVLCACSSEDSNGDERILFGSSNGFVYQMDKGTSFDGASVTHFMRLAFNHFKTPYHNKRFFEAVFELEAPSAITLSITADMSYAHPDVYPPLTEDIDIVTAGGFWDVGAWETFNFDNAVVASGEVYLDGSGQNLGLLIAGSGVYDEPHTIQGVLIHYAVRGLKR